MKKMRLYDVCQYASLTLLTMFFLLAMVRASGIEILIYCSLLAVFSIAFFVAKRLHKESIVGLIEIAVIIMIYIKFLYFISYNETNKRSCLCLGTASF